VLATTKLAGTVNNSELTYSGDKSGYHRKDKQSRNVFAEEGNNARHSKYYLETGDSVVLLARQTLLEALFRWMKYSSGVADRWKPKVSVFQSAVLTQDMQTKIRSPTIRLEAKFSRFISARFFSL
jgi:hypothetical protein